MALQPGDPAPAFSAMAVGGEYGDGTPVSLGDFAARTVVLYFYPKDDTPGCTQQACSLRDGWAQFARRAVLFGVSPDSIGSHARFIGKHALPFPLLSDGDKKIVESYGVWIEKSMYGKKYMGAERSTFVIRPGGRIGAILRKVKPAEHASQLLALLPSAADERE